MCSVCKNFRKYNRIKFDLDEYRNGSYKVETFSGVPVHNLTEYTINGEIILAGIYKGLSITWNKEGGRVDGVLENTLNLVMYKI